MRSTLPAGSIARTSNVWGPALSPEWVVGDVQAANAPASSLHWNVEPASLEVNSNVAHVPDVAGGPLLIVVWGGVVSVGPAVIVHVRLAGVGSTLPAASAERTSKVCTPGVRPVYARGFVHAWKAVSTVLSRRQAKVEPGSVAEKPKLAPVLVVEGGGLAVMEVLGGVVSGGGAATNRTTSCGGLLPFSRLWNCCSASWFSAASRTRKPCWPPAAYMACTCDTTFQVR